MSATRDFRELLATGQRGRGGFLSLVARPRSDGGLPSRLALAVRVSGGSVVRNRVKRRLREAFRMAGPPRGYDIVIRAGEEVATVDFRELVDDLEGALKRAGAAA
jgi:ribonuclease P protein component